MSEVVKIKSHGKSYLINNPGGHIGKPIEKGVPYEHKMLDEIRRLGLRGSALDVGAHVGNHSLYLAAICGLTVWAFEPYGQSYELLCENVALNPELQIEPSPLALGGQREIREWSPEQKMTLRSPMVQDGTFVGVTPFDDLVCPVDLVLVKVDVEGMEPDVFAGMRETLRTHKPLIYSEAHTDEAINAQREVLEPLGYKIRHYVHMGSRMLAWGVDG